LILNLKSRLLLIMAPKALIRQPDAVVSWDAYTAFNVTGRFSRGMNCYGINKQGRRCAWGIPEIKYDGLRQILDYVETQPPQEAAKYLRDIASLSLCQDFHQNQAYDLEDEWREMLKKIPHTVAKGPTPEEKLQESIKEAQDGIKKGKILQEVKAKLGQYKAEAEKYEGQLLTERQTFEVERKRLTTLQNDTIQKYEAQLTSLENKLGGQLHAARQEVEIERQKSQDLEVSKDQSSKKIKNLEGRNLFHARNIKALEFAAALLRKEKEQMKEKSVEQEKELALKTTSIDTLLTAKTALLKDVEGLKSELEASKSTVEKLKATAKEAEWSEKSLSDQAQYLQTSLDEERKFNAGLLATETDLLDKLNKVRAEMATRVAEAGDRDDEVKRLTKTNSELVVERDTLQTRLDSAERKLALYRGEGSDVLKEIDQLKLLNACLTTEKATIQTNLGLKETELVTRQDEVTALIKDVNRLKLSNSGLTSERQTLQTRLGSTESHLATRQQEVATLAEEVKNLKTANSRLADERKTLQTKLGIEEGELSSLLQQLQLLNEQNEAARQRPFRFMTKCWVEKVRRSRKKNRLENISSREEGSVAI